MYRQDSKITFLLVLTIFLSIFNSIFSSNILIAYCSHYLQIYQLMTNSSRNWHIQQHYKIDSPNFVQLSLTSHMIHPPIWSPTTIGHHWVWPISERKQIMLTYLAPTGKVKHLRKWVPYELKENRNKSWFGNMLNVAFSSQIGSIFE